MNPTSVRAACAANGGRGARGKTIVFGIYKRHGSVYTEIIPNCTKASIQAIVRGRVELSSTIHTDGFRSYDGIVHMGHKKHYRVRHSHSEFVRGHSHINGIESFWSKAQNSLVKVSRHQSRNLLFTLEGMRV